MLASTEQASSNVPRERFYARDGTQRVGLTDNRYGTHAARKRTAPSQAMGLFKVQLAGAASRNTGDGASS
jgi:hypothetical protein